MQHIVTESLTSIIDRVKAAWAAGKYAIVTHRWYEYKPVCPVRELGRYLDRNIVYKMVVIPPNTKPCETCSEIVAGTEGGLDERRCFWRSDGLPLDGAFMVPETGDISYIEDWGGIPEERIVVICADRIV